MVDRQGDARAAGQMGGRAGRPRRAAGELQRSRRRLAAQPGRVPADDDHRHRLSASPTACLTSTRTRVVGAGCKDHPLSPRRFLALGSIAAVADRIARRRRGPRRRRRPDSKAKHEDQVPAARWPGAARPRAVVFGGLPQGPAGPGGSEGREGREGRHRGARARREPGSVRIRGRQQDLQGSLRRQQRRPARAQRRQDASTARAANG